MAWLPIPTQDAAGEAEPRVDSLSARRIAGEFLIDEVGGLLSAGEPRLESDRWAVPILLSNVVQGRLGEVGTVGVDASDGKILFAEEERAEVRARARLLAEGPAP